MTMNITGRRPSRYLEAQHVQIPLVAHIQRRAVPGLVYFHPANGAWYGEGSRQGALFKAMGVRAGVSDLILYRNGQLYALELKKLKGGRATAEQEQFLADVVEAGGMVAIAHGLDEALAKLEEWGLIRGATAFALDLPLPEPRVRLMPRAAVHRLSQDGVARLAAPKTTRLVAPKTKQLPPPK